jgi:hypothetical protein
VVTTSKFNDVKARLLAMHNKRKIDTEDPNKSRLRRTPGSGNGPVDADEDERPTLKRRPSN